ncbi:MAG: DUF1588 domain-containing protein [Nannocystaceae bacterium]
MDWVVIDGKGEGARVGLLSRSGGLLAAPLLVLATACAGGGGDGSEASTAASATTGSSDSAATEDATATSGTTGDSGETGDSGDTEDTGETGTTGDGGDEPSGNQLDQNALFVCDGLPAMSPGDLRLLDRYEWTRNVGSWTGSSLSRNPLYARPDHRYSTYSEDESLDPSVLSLYLDVVANAGSPWTKGKYDGGRLRTVWEDPETLCFINNAAPTPECVRYFVRRYLERGSLYRPASEAQIEALYDFAQDALADEMGGDRSVTIKKIAAAAWMSAAALMRPELGAGAADEHGRLRLSDWELAQAITYALTRTPPAIPSVNRSYNEGFSKGDVNGDLAGFLQAASDGSIKDPEVVGDLVREYIGGVDEERRDLAMEPGDNRDWETRGEYWMAFGVRDFFREWLDYGGLASQPPKVEIASTSGWSGTAISGSYHNTITGVHGYENTQVTQLDDAIARVLAGDKDVFHTLLTTRMFYTPATAGYQQGESTIWKSTADMNKVYNVDQVTPRTREARWIEMPMNERAGVLTHPAWLGAHSLSFENDPNLVHRGKWIREELLCQNIPDLPINVDAALSDESADQSARQRISEQIDKDPYCASCHQLMNPLGYPFEIYNHAGFVRVEDHGGEPDGSSTLSNMPSPELDGPVGSAIELSERLAGSPYAKRCFIRQTFRYFVGREETMRDACTLVALEDAYDSSGGSFTELLVTLFNSDSFQYRVQQ